MTISTLGDMVRDHAQARPLARAMAFEGRITTYGELDRRTNQVAQALRAAGLAPGDRIAHLGKNSDLYFELLLGAAKAGVVTAPINWRLAPPEIAHVLADSTAKLLFVGPEFIDLARSPALDFPWAATIGMESPLPGGDFASWRDGQSHEDLGVQVTPDDAVVQLYTSGTTGLPKGVVLSHDNFLALQRAQSGPDYAWNRWGDDDVALAAMPGFHVGGVGWPLTAFYNGALAVVVREFDPLAVLDFIETWRISKLLLVPAAMQLVVRQPNALTVDFSRLKYIFYGASPIPLDLLRESMAVFGSGFVQLYGMTETAGAVVALGPEDHDPAGNARMRSAGRPLPGVEIQVWGDDGRALPAGEVGEIVIRSASNMLGYFGQLQATADTLVAGGWLRTGDAGYLDADGYVFIHDRVKDMIISGGENIYPAEVENAVFGHPDVAEVAAIGVPSDRWGEEVKAIVVLRPGVEPDPEALIAWARGRIAGYKTPKSVDFMDVLPRNASGKILRRELRASYWKAREGPLV